MSGWWKFADPGRKNVDLSLMAEFPSRCASWAQQSGNKILDTDRLCVSPQIVAQDAPPGACGMPYSEAKRQSADRGALIARELTFQFTSLTVDYRSCSDAA